MKKKKAARGLLSFGGDDDEDGEQGNTAGPPPPARSLRPSEEESSEPAADSATAAVPRRRLAPNPNSTLPAPRALTKAALAADALTRDKLRKDFLEIQEAVKETEIAIPFVFYDGANIPGGTVKLKKGDHIWLFLERCRKVGAEHGVSGTGSGTGASLKSREDSKKQWARVGVDDLICVRGEVIVPHVSFQLVRASSSYCRGLFWCVEIILTDLCGDFQHYELYYFIANKVKDPTREGQLLFDYSGTTAKREQSGEEVEAEEASLLRVPGQEQQKLEGYNDDPGLTKVVDRRWYEKNKHIYPASVWKEYKAGKEFEESAKGRRDALGNAFFFS